jgi:rhodanese-related sulfurtransferase
VNVDIDYSLLQQNSADGTNDGQFHDGRASDHSKPAAGLHPKGKGPWILIPQLFPLIDDVLQLSKIEADQAGAVNIPLTELRARLGELPRDREILVICRSAQRAYYATRILLQNGFKARNISGGMLSRSILAAK